MEENRDEGMVKPTIVGVRPPEGRVDFKARPIGIEILLKKAKVDPEFKIKLLKERAAVAALIFMQLEPEEEAILNSIPEEQLSQMVDRTEVKEEIKSAFEKYAAAVMIAALGLTPVLAAGCGSKHTIPTSIDIPPATLTATMTPANTQTMSPAATPTITSTVETATPTGVIPIGTTTFTATNTCTGTPADTFTATPSFTSSMTATRTNTPSATSVGTTTFTPTITVSSTPILATPTFTTTTLGITTATPTPTVTP